MQSAVKDFRDSRGLLGTNRTVLRFGFVWSPVSCHRTVQSSEAFSVLGTRERTPIYRATHVQHSSILFASGSKAGEGGPAVCNSLARRTLRTLLDPF